MQQVFELETRCEDRQPGCFVGRSKGKACCNGHVNAWWMIVLAPIFLAGTCFMENRLEACASLCMPDVCMDLA